MPHLQYFALTPLTEDHRASPPPGFQIAVCPQAAPYITFPQLEATIEERNRNEHLLAKTNEALLTFTNELKRLKKVLLHAVGHSQSEQPSGENSATSGGDQSIDVVIRKLVKFKEDNKKLKAILK